MEVVEQQRRCDLCRRASSGTVGAPVSVGLCPACVAHVAEVVLAGHLEWLPNVWKVKGPLSSKPRPEVDALTDEELETHADLAVAYAEMGLVPDALKEAALVLSRGAATRYSTQALAVVFGERLAQPGALSELRRRLFPS